MKKKSRRWYLVAIALTIVCIVGGIQVFFMQEKPPHYLTAEVTRGDIENAVIAMGMLHAFKQVDVGAQVSGQLKSLKIELGAKVVKGQWLAEIDPVISQNTLRQARLHEADLLAQKRSTLAQLKQAKLSFQRQRRLLPSEATSREKFEAAQAALEQQRAKLASLEAQISTARIEIETAQAKLDFTRIVAPLDGEVVAIVAQEGQTVIAQDQAPVILKLAELETMTIKAQVSEADVIRIYPGQPVYFTILGEPDKRYYGKLRAIEPAPYDFQTQSSSSGMKGSDGKSNTAVFYNALFEVPNPDRRLRISMTAQVNILLDTVQHALNIPAAALGEKAGDDKYVVRVLDINGKPETRHIRIGINNHIRVEVLSGLTEGERIVLDQATEDVS